VCKHKSSTWFICEHSHKILVYCWMKSFKKYYFSKISRSFFMRGVLKLNGCVNQINHESGLFETYSLLCATSNSCHHYIQLSKQQYDNLVMNNILYPNVNGYKYINDWGMNMLEFHVDDHNYCEKNPIRPDFWCIIVSTYTN
jgi:hypothetical protein